MRWRKFTALVGAAATAPFHAVAQQATKPIIGFLGSNSVAAFAPHVSAFRRGLADAGYADGQELTKYRWADDRYEQLPALAPELVARGVTVIHATDSPAAKAANPATVSIPIIGICGGTVLSM